MHYFIIVNYRGACQNELPLLSSFIYSMTYRIPYYRSDLPFIYEAGSVTFKQ